jgi:predicted nucleotidyltransferase component of viral defense system
VKDHVLEIVKSQSSTNGKINLMREYLQACILRILHAEGVFRSTAFVGGTALRFLHDLPRFSEDLNFTVAEKKGIPFVPLIKTIKHELELAGYTITVTIKDEKTVLSSFIKFENLLFEAGLSSHKNQNFSIKLEFDTNPPKGAGTDTVVVNKFFPIAYLTYDLPSLFGGKMHALLNRPYTKGRDFFDLGWYLSRWKGLTPNLPLLQNALKQTGWEKEYPTELTWRHVLYEKVERADWKKVRKDVENFLERPSDVEIFTQENVLRLIQG